MSKKLGSQKPKGSVASGLRVGMMKRVVCSFDDETFDVIRASAVKNGTSFAEQVRLFVEWGLEK